MNTDGFYSVDLTPKEVLAIAWIKEAIDGIKSLNKKHFDDAGNRTDDEATYNENLIKFKEQYIGITYKNIQHKGVDRYVGQARSYASDLLNSPLYLSRWTDATEYEKRKIALKREIITFNDAIKSRSEPKEDIKRGFFNWKKVFIEPVKGGDKSLNLVAKVLDDVVLRVSKVDGKWNAYVGVDVDAIGWREENRTEFKGQYRWLCGGYGTPEDARDQAQRYFMTSFKLWALEGDMVEEENLTV